MKYHDYREIILFYTYIHVYIMSNSSYIRLLNKSKINKDRIYYNLNIPVDICNELQLETGNKMIVRLDNDNIIIKRLDV